jgi:hypothetical protein
MVVWEGLVLICICQCVFLKLILVHFILLYQWGDCVLSNMKGSVVVELKWIFSTNFVSQSLFCIFILVFYDLLTFQFIYVAVGCCIRSLTLLVCDKGIETYPWWFFSIIYSFFQLHNHSYIHDPNFTCNSKLTNQINICWNLSQHLAKTL